MRLKIDNEAGAAYVYFEYPPRQRVKETIALNDYILVDLGKRGRLIGIEILNASKNLGKRILRK